MFSFQLAVRFYMYLQFYIRFIIIKGCYILNLKTNKNRVKIHIFIDKLLENWFEMKQM